MVLVRAPYLVVAAACAGVLLASDGVRAQTNCKYTLWKYELCNKSTGNMAKSRTLIAGSSTKCKDTTGSDPCDVDCEMKWGDWSTCTGGSQSRTEINSVAKKNNGVPCPTARTETQPCKVDCVMEYQDASSVACDKATGLKTLVEKMKTPPQVGGNACPAAQIKTVACNVDCVVGYPAWDFAVHTCDPLTGLRTRTQIVQIEARNSGTSCPALQSETKPCVVDCELKYGAWSATCDQDTGLKERKQEIMYSAQNGGRADDLCLADAVSDYKKCDVNCDVQWGPFSECDKVTGVKKSSQYINVQPKNKGTACEPLKFKTEVCAIDCVMKFPPWDPILHQCNKATGQRVRFEEIVVLPNTMGAACPTPKKEVLECPVNCEMKLPEWNVDAHPCDLVTGLQTRTEVVAVQAKNGGSACPRAQSDTKTCKVDCKLSAPEWADVTCNKATGMKTRTETKVVDPKNGGLSCAGAKTETKTCAVDCENKFPDWDPTVHLCDKATGLRTRTEVTAIEAKYSGAACPSTRKDLLACPVDCEMMWPAWDANLHPCDKNTGLRARKQISNVSAKNGGRNCPLPAEETIKCPVDCETDYPDWAAIPCTAGNTKTRAQVPVISTKNGGKPCDFKSPQVTLCAYVSGQNGNVLTTSNSNNNFGGTDDHN